MSKWIDADAFLKEYCEPYPHIYKAMSRAMADAPSIDIVRCKECKWAKANGTYQWCGRLDSTARITADDFCSYGERREP